MSWQDGYYNGPMRDGYPATYFNESGGFEYPWQKNVGPRNKKKKETPQNEEDE